AAQVQVPLLLDDAPAVGAEPVLGLGREGERQPIRQVDKVLVLDPAAVDNAGRPVVDPGVIGARVVHPVGPGLGPCSADCEPPVAQRAQRLPPALVVGIEPFVRDDPGPLLPVLRHRLSLVSATASCSISPRSRTARSAPCSSRRRPSPCRSTPMTSPKPPRTP